MENTKITSEIITAAHAALESHTGRSAWDKGVNAYALELLEELKENVQGGYITSEQLSTRAGIRAALLGGADNWKQYSWGGSALIYNSDIAERLCSPSELKKTRNGERRPNIREEWLDTQARALSQAARRVANALIDATVETTKQWERQESFEALDERAAANTPPVTEARVKAESEAQEETPQMVKTNIGTMPVEDYREIKAAQYGFDSYEDMYRQGYRLGGGYDIAPEPEAVAPKWEPMEQNGCVLQVGAQPEAPAPEAVHEMDEMEI